MIKTKPSLVFFSLLMVFSLGCNLFTNTLPDAVQDQDLPASSPVPLQEQDFPASSPAPEQGVVLPVSSPILPAPPEPLAVSPQDPEQAASTLADALAGPENLAAWLGLYQALGIPVIGEERTALDGSDDPIGPPYWQVWYAASLDMPGHGILVSDAGRLLGLAFGMDAEDSQALGETLLSDLRLALQSQDPAVRLMGAVARERILRSGSQLDILDSATTAQTASIDVPLLQLLFWVALRANLFQLSPQAAVPQSGMALASYRLTSSLLQTGGFDCAKALGDEDVTYWANWLSSKLLGGGVQLPGMEESLPGVLETSLKYMKVNADTIQATGKAVGWANVIGGSVSFLMQLSSMDVVGIQAPDKLERTKNTSPGKTATITWRLKSDPGKLPDGKEARQCFISFISSVLGVGFNFPADARIAGAEIDFKGGKNVPERARFGDYKEIRSWTNKDGQATLEVEGSPQKKQLPESSRSIDEEYSVFVSAQPEESGLNTMANIFFGGLTFGAAPGAAGLIGGLIDMLKTFTYDMGEHVFMMKDWRAGYSASGGQGIDITGTICGGLTDPFQLEGAIPDGSNATFSYSPTSSNGGSYTYAGSGGGFSFSGSGNYTIEEQEPGDDTLLLTQTETRGCVNLEGGGCKEYTNTITLTPLESCSQ